VRSFVPGLLSRMTVCAVVAFLCTVCVSPRARADNLVAAKRLYRRAEQAFRASDYERALTLYLQAYQNKPLAGFLFNIAQCYRALGRYDKAIEHFEAYLRRSDNARNKRQARDLLRECRQRRAAQRSAESSAGALRSAQREPGLEIRSHGEAQQSAPVGQQRASLRARSMSDSESPPAISGTDAGQRRRDRAGGVHPAYFWTAVGLTAAFSLVTLGTGMAALNLSDKYNDPSTPADELRDTKDRGEGLATTANVMFGLTLVGAAASTTLFFFTDFASDAANTTVSFAPTTDGAAVAVHGRF
jgi:tetratricopeptide (TPR) repeat protein